MGSHQPEPAALVPAASWAVWRMEENGCIAKVRGGLTEVEAYRAMGGLAARGHGRGRYWVESEAAERVAAPEQPRD